MSELEEILRQGYVELAEINREEVELFMAVQCEVLGLQEVSYCGNKIDEERS